VVSHHINDLITNLQDQQKLISGMFEAVRALEIKLKLFWKQLENVNLSHFFSCDLIYKDQCISVSFPGVSVVKIIDAMAHNFKMRFSDFS
jgi:hypothetical protein